MRRSVIAAVALAGALPPAGAQTLFAQSGRCQSLTLADRGVSGQCEDTILAARFAEDRFGFVLSFRMARRPNRLDGQRSRRQPHRLRRALGGRVDTDDRERALRRAVSDGSARAAEENVRRARPANVGQTR